MPLNLYQVVVAPRVYYLKMQWTHSFKVVDPESTNWVNFNEAGVIALQDKCLNNMKYSPNLTQIQIQIQIQFQIQWILAHLVHVSITLKLQVTGLTVSNVSSVFELPRRERKKCSVFRRNSRSCSQNKVKHNEAKIFVKSLKFLFDLMGFI